MAFEVEGLDDEANNEFHTRERKKENGQFLAGVRDILAYIAFLVLYTIVIQTSAVELAYPMASKMKQEVQGETFEGILAVDDIWDYLSGHFIDVTFLDERDDGLIEEIPSGRWGYILDVNRMVGAIQFQQNRVDVGGALPWNATPTCVVPQVFADEIDKCYPSLADGGMASDPFGGTCGCDTSMFSPICATSPCEDSFFAEEGKDVYLWTLPINITAAAARLRLANLRERGWIDLQTRDFRVYLTVYNPAVDLFSNVELMFQPQQSGGIEVAATFKTFNMVRHMLMLTEASKDFPATGSDTGSLVCEILFYIIAVFLWLQIMVAWKSHGLFRFFLSFWRIMDLLNYTMFMVVIGLRIYVLSLLNQLNFNPPSNIYADFNAPAWSIYQVSNLMALSSILMWLKLLRFLQLSRRLSQLTQTIARAAIDMSNFMLIFLVVYIAYAQAFFMAFGMDIESFSSYSKSFSSLFLIILGDFDFDAMTDANPEMAPLLFFSFVIFVFFILVNMFIAILGEAHNAVMESTEHGDADPDEWIRKMRRGWERRVSSLDRGRKASASSSVQALAKAIEKEEDVRMPPVDEDEDELGAPSAPPAAAERNGLEAGEAGAQAEGEESPRADAAAGHSYGAFGVSNVRRNVKSAKARLGVMSLGEVMSAARGADGDTLLQALNEQVDSPPDSGSGKDAAGGLGRHSRLLGLSHSLVDEMAKRVKEVEDDNEALKQWLQTEHAATQEKISLLTEATFTITNMLAGVQGVETKKLLETTDGSCSGVLAGLQPPSSFLQGVTAEMQGGAVADANQQHPQVARKRATMIAGAKAGRDK